MYHRVQWTDGKMDGFAECFCIFIIYLRLFYKLNERADVVCHCLAKGLFSEPIKCAHGETVGGTKPVIIQGGFISILDKNNTFP